MEKKQQKEKSFEHTKNADNRNVNNDKNIDRAYEEKHQNLNTDKEIDEDDAAHEKLKEESKRNGTDF